MQSAYAPLHNDLHWGKYGQTLEAEKALPFTMSELYISRRRAIERFAIDYFFNAAWGIVMGFFMFYQSDAVS